MSRSESVLDLRFQWRELAVRLFNPRQYEFLFKVVHIKMVIDPSGFDLNLNMILIYFVKFISIRNINLKFFVFINN